MGLRPLKGIDKGSFKGYHEGSYKGSFRVSGLLEGVGFRVLKGLGSRVYSA